MPSASLKKQAYTPRIFNKRRKLDLGMTQKSIKKKKFAEFQPKK